MSQRNPPTASRIDPSSACGLRCQVHGDRQFQNDEHGTGVAWRARKRQLRGASGVEKLDVLDGQNPEKVAQLERVVGNLNCRPFEDYDAARQHPFPKMRP